MRFRERGGVKPWVLSTRPRETGLIFHIDQQGWEGRIESRKGRHQLGTWNEPTKAVYSQRCRAFRAGQLTAFDFIAARLGEAIKDICSRHSRQKNRRRLHDDLPDHARYYSSFSAFFAALVNFLMMRSRLSFEMWSMNSTPLT